MNVSAERIRQQIAAILSAWGMDADLVRSTTEVMVETDLAGIDSHEPIGPSGALADAPGLIPGAD